MNSQFEQGLDRDIAGSIFIKTLDGWILDSMFGYAEEVLVQKDFKLSGVDIPVGAYRGPRGYIALLSPYAGSRWDFRTIYAYYGGFFGGTNHTVSPTIRLSLSRHIRLTTDYTYSRFTLPNRKDNTDGSVGIYQGSEQAVNGGLVITPNVNTQIDLVGQLNTQANSE